jgi:SAM-dependent methyltransferase
MLKTFLSHPQTRGIDIDDIRTTVIRCDIIRSKQFLSKLYLEWYKEISKRLQIDNHVLELGSGSGFLSEIIPNIITSELFPVPGVERVVDAHKLPFKDNELDSIVMTDVLHHIPDVTKFFHEATRCIKHNGRLVMIEPWNTPWSKWVYQNLHHEPFDPNGGWTFPSSGPLSGANGALPWILFERDREQFERQFSDWSIEEIKIFMPFSYLLSGGVSFRSFLPGLSYRFVRWLEKPLESLGWGMFAIITIVKSN